MIGVRWEQFWDKHCDTIMRWGMTLIGSFIGIILIVVLWFGMSLPFKERYTISEVFKDDSGYTVVVYKKRPTSSYVVNTHFKTKDGFIRYVKEIDPDYYEQNELTFTSMTEGKIND